MKKIKPTITPNVAHYLGEMFPKGYLIISIDEEGKLIQSNTADSDASMWAIIKGLELFLNGFYRSINSDQNDPH